MKTPIPKITFVLALFMALLGCENNQKEEQVTPLTQEQILTELKAIYREFGKNPERIQLGKDTDSVVRMIKTVEEYEEYKLELRERLKNENGVTESELEEKKALMRKQIKDGTAQWSEHVIHYPDPNAKKKR